MRRHPLFLFVLFILVSSVAMTFTSSAHASPRSVYASSACVNSSGTNTLHGTLGGANYTISVPSNWNGTLALYSHGYVFPTQPLVNPAPDAGDALTAGVLLQQGYALAGSSYSQNGWALQQAFSDQITLLNFFDATCGRPMRTIAWGHSLGGIITAGLAQLFPGRFDAALPMCGVVAGGIATWNQALDSSFAFNILLAGGTLPPVHITDAAGSFSRAEAILAAAQKTAAGRARIALVSALADVPGWFNSASPEPASNDFASQEANQFLWESQVDFAFAFGARAELEARAGGNPSWNTGVDYRTQLKVSASTSEVKALYKQAGLNLNDDLDALNSTTRIKADPGAKAYLNQFVTFDGDLDMPVLTMHTTGDGLVVNQDEQSYASVTRANGDSSMLRQVFVHRAGHCAFTPAETLTAFQTLIQRLDTGKWGHSTDPQLMNQEAASLGSTLNIAPPSFLKFSPTPFLRPFVRN